MIVTSPQKLISGIKKDSIYVFLAGPIQGASSWQFTMPDIPGVTWVNPRRENFEGFDWKKQVDWETLGLRVSDYILFWIPTQTEHMDSGRDYAQTTRMELVENLVRGKKVILGIEPGIHAKRYMEEKYHLYSTLGLPIFSTLGDCINALKQEIDKRKPNIWFTSDTHFGHNRTLDLSRRPFKGVKEMNMTMIEKWNNLVLPDDEVYHLGDFGDYDYLRYLNGRIHLIKGNYDSHVPLDSGFVEILESPTNIELEEIPLTLCHKPSNRSKNGFTLFGHIHGTKRNIVKGLNVGIDCHNYMPISLDTVKFYMNAPYDNEVYCSN